MVGKEEVDKKGEMAGLGKGEGCGDWERATQADPYSLAGWLFFGWFGGGWKVVWGEGRDIQGPGKGLCSAGLAGTSSEHVGAEKPADG